MNENLTPDEILEIFRKPEETNYTLETLSSELGVEVEKLYDMDLEEISELSKKIADKKTSRINSLLTERDKAFGIIEKAKEDHGITSKDMSRVFFEDIKKN